MDETVALRVDEVHTQDADCTEAVKMSALDLTDGDPNDSVDMDKSTHSPVTFEVIDSASNEGQTLLVDTHGFSYCKKATRGSKVYWQCSQLTKSVVCHVTVIQDGSRWAHTSTCIRLRLPPYEQSVWYVHRSQPV